MNILFVTNLYPPESVGGYEEICKDVADGLADRGHRVHVVTCHSRRKLKPESDVYRVLDLHESLAFRCSLRLGIQNGTKVDRLVNRLRPDAVMVWNARLLGRMVLSAMQTIPTFYYLQDPWLEPLLRPVFRRGVAASRLVPQAKLAYHAASRVVCSALKTPAAHQLAFNSLNLRSQYGRRGCDVSTSTVIYNGVAPGRFPLVDQHIVARRLGEPYRLLYCGRLAPEKGVSTAIRALSLLRRVDGLSGAQLTLLGAAQDTAYLEELHSLVDWLGLRGAVHIRPHEPRERVTFVHREHDILVFPSEWEEPFGLSLLEGMASGMPVVATLRGGTSEFVREGVNALTFRPGIPDDLASKAGWLLTHPSEASALGLRASRSVGADYSLARQLDQVEAFLSGRADYSRLVAS